jgi:hypothetical protein
MVWMTERASANTLRERLAASPEQDDYPTLSWIAMLPPLGALPTVFVIVRAKQYGVDLGATV